MLNLRIHVLGRTRLCVSSADALPIPRSCEGLVSLLAHASMSSGRAAFDVSRGRGLERFEAAQQLWPNGTEKAARRNLSTALWRLKACDQRLESAFVGQESDRIRFASHVRLITDVMAFERFATEFLNAPSPRSTRQWHRAFRAKALYVGDAFLALDVDWADIERERLRNLYLDLLHEMAAEKLASNCPADAIRIGQTLAALDPYREEVHRLLMRAHMAAGNRAKAILQYRICEGEISQALGTAPMAETVALYETLVALADRRTPLSAEKRRSELLAQADQRLVEIVQINRKQSSLLQGLQALLGRVGPG